MVESALRLAADRIDRAGLGVEDNRTLRAAFLDEISRHVAHDAYAWLLTDPETEVGADPLADVPCMAELPTLIRLKYSTEMNRWSHLTNPVGRLQEATAGHPERSLVWTELLSRYDVEDVASVVFRDRFGCWGFLDLWRTGRGRVFTAGEEAYLSAVAPVVTKALRGCQARTFAAARPIGLPEGPVVLVLSGDLEVRSQTAATDAYLRALVPPDDDRSPVPAGAYNVGAQLLANEAGVDAHAPTARVHLAHGAWLSLRAARMAAPGRAAADLAVTIDRTSPAERMDLFARAHGLTPREGQVLAGLARGADTRQLAGDLRVSPNTVQDHLKSVFEKTGTRSRRALLARALGR